MTSAQSDAMDPVRLQLLLTGVREAIGDLPGQSVTEASGPRFRRTADSPLFDGLGFDRPAGADRSSRTEIVPSPQLRPGGARAVPLLNPTSLAAVIQRSRRVGGP